MRRESSSRGGQRHGPSIQVPAGGHWTVWELNSIRHPIGCFFHAYGMQMASVWDPYAGRSERGPQD